MGSNSNFCRFSQPQIQSSSGAVVVLCVLLYWAKDVVNFPATLINFVLLGSFSLHFGCQLWVTFVAGFLMFRCLPRVTFGHVQSCLFPVYFLLSLAMSVVTTVAYLMSFPSRTWSSWSHYIQISALLVAMITSMANCLVFSPGTIAAMLDRYEEEKCLGVSEVVGKIDNKKLRQDYPKYDKLHTDFIRWHCYSSLSNVLTLAANLVFMYCLAARLTLVVS